MTKIRSSSHTSKSISLDTSAKLKEKVTEFRLNQPEYKALVKDLAKKIRIQAKAAPNEATIASHFEILLYAFLKEQFDIKFLPEKEVCTDALRHTAKGRMDSRLSALIIEYKHINKLKKLIEQDNATKQITDYMNSEHSKTKHEVVGLITDGNKAKFVAIDDAGVLVQDSFEELSGTHIDRLIRSIVLLEKTALTPENLVKDFCGDDGVVKELAISLYDALKNHTTERTKMLFNEWKALFKLAHDDVSKQKVIQERREALATALDISIIPNDNETEYMALYSIQTAYAIIVKNIAYKVISAIRSQNSIIRFSKLAQSDSSTIRTHLYRLEDGAVFREMGFGNLLEGDFFAWYCTDNQWSKNIASCVQKVFSVLTRYEDLKMLGGDAKIQDLCKDLYMHAIPDKVRYSLGEFYTPPWLADNLVSRAIELSGKSVWKGLDPCCGSGTFITTLIRRALDEVEGKSRKVKLRTVLDRVKGIDLNPLAVLTARINYFINLSHLIEDDDEFEIPIYLGDSSYVPQRIKIGKVDCLQYQLATLKGQIKIVLPVSATSKPHLFSIKMTEIETHIKNQDEQAIVDAILSLTKKTDATEAVKKAICELALQLVDLEKNDWNGIWARIITNFLTTANIGNFDLVVGNPPWIDWKNLPANYRERIKTLCIDRKLFSGDSITGGINLNVCALISNVVADNWLATDGILAFLMPENMIFQQSYEGFRKFPLKNGERLYFQELFNWTRSGHPFKPVQYKFLTFFISNKKIDYHKGIPVRRFVKKTGKGSVKKNLANYRNSTLFSDVETLFDIKNNMAVVPSKTNTIFTYIEKKAEIACFKKIAGKSAYTGREGIEFYPQELFLLRLSHASQKKAQTGKVLLSNFQSPKSKHKIASTNRLLETKFLYPLVKGINIQRFHIDPPEFYVPFPYDQNYGNGRKPITPATLTKESPLLMKYLNTNKEVMEAQTGYNNRIIGNKNDSEFYAIARVGEYSHADCYVAFRDNTKWQAAVVRPITTPWGEIKHPVFQNHAVTICERPSGGFISEDEAHYICAILNAPIVGLYMRQSSDSRSFKIRPPVKIPEYDMTNPKHIALRDLSIEAHNCYDDLCKISAINRELDKAYLALFVRSKK